MNGLAINTCDLPRDQINSCITWFGSASASGERKFISGKSSLSARERCEYRMDVGLLCSRDLDEILDRRERSYFSEIGC